MNSTPPTLLRNAPAVTFVVAAGLIVATLDIGYASLYWGLKAQVPPQRIFQSVAAGLLGPKSFQGGAATAALGLALHYGIAMAMAFAYYLMARRWSLLTEHAVPCGLAYGLLLYAVMQYVVLPLSAVKQGNGPKDHLWVTLSVIVHAVVVGLPIALCVRHALRDAAPAATAGA
jgi:uncharacterized membrane protein YagU involved in acid resistance